MKETTRVHCCSCGAPVALQIDQDGLRRALAAHWRDDLAMLVLAHVTVQCRCSALERPLTCAVCGQMMHEQALAGHVAQAHPVSAQRVAEAAGPSLRRF